MNTEIDTQVTLSSVFQPVLGAMAGLAKKLGHGSAIGGEVNHLESFLETLPLKSDDFGIACNRLRNARRYLESNERGAARWEMNALANQLRNQATAKTREPRRRLRS